MAKKITGYIKLQVPAGKANPAPPIGPALGQHGVNIMEFCKAFNAKTSQMDPDLKIPVVITVYADRSFTFETKTPPAADLLKKAAGIPKGACVDVTWELSFERRRELFDAGARRRNATLTNEEVHIREAGPPTNSRASA